MIGSATPTCTSIWRRPWRRSGRNSTGRSHPSRSLLPSPLTPSRPRGKGPGSPAHRRRGSKPCLPGSGETQRADGGPQRGNPCPPRRRKETRRSSTVSPAAAGEMAEGQRGQHNSQTCRTFALPLTPSRPAGGAWLTRPQAQREQAMSPPAAEETRRSSRVSPPRRRGRWPKARGGSTTAEPVAPSPSPSP